MSKPMFVPRAMVERLIEVLGEIRDELENANENFRLFVKVYAKDMRGRR